MNIINKDNKFSIVLSKEVAEANNEELVNFHPNRNTATLSLKKKDFLRFLEHQRTKVIIENKTKNIV